MVSELPTNTAYFSILPPTNTDLINLSVSKSYLTHALFSHDGKVLVYGLGLAMLQSEKVEMAT